MYDHGGEENRIKPRKRRFKACNETPAKREIEITSVMNFASVAVYEFDK